MTASDRSTPRTGRPPDGDQTRDARERPDEDPAPDAADEATDGGHLRDVADGAGCTEIWEHLSRDRTDGDDDE